MIQILNPLTICSSCYYIVVGHCVHCWQLANEIRKQVKVVTVKYSHYLSNVTFKTSGVSLEPDI